MKKILITGCSSGFGVSLVKSLCKDFFVIVAARRIKKMKNFYKKEKNIEIHKLDLSRKKDLLNFINTVKKKHKYIPYIINNAAVFPKYKINEIEYKDLEYSFNVNTFAPTIIMKHFLPIMEKNNFGRIVNLTSGAPFNCSENFSIYSASKASLNAFSLTAAKEYQKANIKINLFSPGQIKSEMSPQAITDPKESVPYLRYLLQDSNKLFTGKFIWTNYILPTSPNLTGVQWANAKASKKFKKIKNTK